MGCRDIEEQLNAFLDGELQGVVKDNIVQHLEECSSCRAHVNELMDLITAVQELPFFVMKH